MRNRTLLYIAALLSLLAIAGCSSALPEATVSEVPLSISPDYTRLEIPVNIAPLNFKIKGAKTQACVELLGAHGRMVVKADNTVQFPLKKWKALLSAHRGDSLRVTIYTKASSGWTQHPSFHWLVEADSIDSHLMYRLIEPGYAGWNRVGIYQRNLENFEENTILDNSLTGGNCMNCHVVCGQDPDKLLFHVRNEGGGTFIIRDGEIKKVNIRTEQMLSAGAYPAWHPSARYAVFATNEVRQSYHTRPDRRTEVFDQRSDLVLYDIDKNEIFASPTIASKGSNETFGAFSPDGKRLFFCTVSDSLDLPIQYDKAHYSLVAVDFHPETGQIGSRVDTLVNGPAIGKSVSHPHVSPDGKYLLYSLADFGTFVSWNKESDLWMYEFASGKNRPASGINSEQSESCNSWSSNSDWIVFSSRRMDGLYNRPFIAHVRPDGSFGKPFVVPQKDPDFYTLFFKAYNLPELMIGPVTTDPYELAKMVKEKEYKAIDVKNRN